MSAFADPLLPEGQRDTWHALNDTDVDLPAMSVADLVLDQIRAHPHRPAVLAAARSLSYRELGSAASELATKLDPSATAVLICVEPGWEQAVAVLAAVFAGVPFHGVHPGTGRPARSVITAELGATVVLTQSWLAERMSWPSEVTVVTVDDVSIGAAGMAPPIDEGSLTARPEDVLCLLAPVSPGSAMRPVLNGAVVDTLTDLADRYDLGPDDRALAVTALGDEVSVTTLLLMLGVGGAVVVPDDIDLWTPATWITLMARDLVTVWHSAPSLAALLAEHLEGRDDGLPSGLRVLLLGGEPLAASLVQRLRRSASGPIQVAHLGVAGSPGLWASCYEVPDSAAGGYLPAGVPLRNKQLYVLGDGGSACPVWVSGKVHVGGRFPPTGTPASVPNGEALWPTELTGRLLPEGVIEVLGENQTRITVHGHPMQLREVEGSLAEHEAVLSAAVVPAGDGSIAYVHTEAGSSVTGPDLLEHLRRRMSPYLLPAAVEAVARFALGHDGRLDRNALAVKAAALQSVPDVHPTSESEPAPVPTELIERACLLAAQILDLSDVEPNMNLLDIGASSVQLVRIAVAAEDELGLVVDIDELLRFPSIAVMVSAATPISALPAEPGLSQSPVETGNSVPQPGGPRSQTGPGSTIRDPLERLAFKDARPGLRHDLSGEGIPLAGSADRLADVARRRTVRRFAAAPVPVARLTALLDVVCDLQSDGDEPRHGYPSAGSLYPVQVYVAVRRDRVDGLSAGTYYVHPDTHRLLAVERGWEVPQSAHGWINREADATSAFSLHLVARTAAINPLYGARSRDYCVLEAGAICQLLMTAATDLGLGLCPVGEMDDAVLIKPLRLDEGDQPIHALLGGLPADPEDELDPARRTADMLRRIGETAFNALGGPDR